MTADGMDGAIPGRAGWISQIASRWFVRLMVITGIAQFVSSSIRPLLTYESLAAGAGPFEVGLVAAAFSTLALAAAIPMGKAVDRRGETGFLIMGGVLVATTLVALMAPVNLVVLGVCSAGLGLGHLSLVAAGQTLIAKGSQPERREMRFATLTTVNAVAQIVGPAVTGFIIGQVPSTPQSVALHVPRSNLVLAFAAGLAVVATISAISLRLRPGALIARPAPQGSPRRRAFSAVMKLPAVPTAMLASLTVLTCVDLLSAYLPVFGQQHGLSVRTVGLLLATQGVASMLIRFWMLRLIARFSRRRLLMGTMALAAVSVASIPLWGMTSRPVPGLFVAMCLAGLGLGVGQPATMAWVAAQTPATLRGTAVSIRLSGNRLGLILVPICAGSLAGALGLAAVFWLPATLLVLSVFLVRRSEVGSHEREG